MMASKLLKNKFIQKVLLFLVGLIFKTLLATIKFKTINPEIFERAKKMYDRDVVLFGCWHEHLISTIMAHAFMKVAPIVSQSEDGEFASHACKIIGFEPVRGSSRRGGFQARMELVKKIEQGYSGAFAVDGPVGPRRVVKPGIVVISRDTGTPVLPLVGLASKNWCLSKTWDKMKIPKPFSVISVYYGEPFLVPSEATREECDEYLKNMADTLNTLEEKAK